MIAQRLAFVAKPLIKMQIKYDKIFKKSTIKQRKCLGPASGCLHDLLCIDPGDTRAQAQVIARDDNNFGFSGSQSVQHPINFLPKGATRLLLRPAAPKQLSKAPARNRSRGSHS